MEAKLTLDAAVTMSRQRSAVKTQQSILRGEATSTVDVEATEHLEA